ncbi:MAG: aminotransferase class I/II-fold pyridoxal phosphate-dependent enzyme [Alphaproteobacteria bacterium]|nr:aminotransferase class I/II-fold pyridoxal phosphate-dependent enzyme [Alphaproteobacteria bacterium]
MRARVAAGPTTLDGATLGDPDWAEWLPRHALLLPFASGAAVLFAREEAFSPSEIALAEALARRGGLLVVDEAFADVAPEVSVAGRVGPGMVVLRSFGKFFGLAGLRLGFAIAPPPLALALRDMMGPWAVAGPAIAIGTRALADRKWMAVTRNRLAREALALDGLLGAAGMTVLGGTPLFRLVSAGRAWALYEYLGERGILVRPFAVSPRWLRFGLPPGAEGRDRLKRALDQWRE